MQKIALFICLLFCLVACKSPFTNESTHVLTEKEMVLILTDLQLAESASRLQLLPEDYLKNPDKWYIEVMNAHKTDTTIFSKSLNYYSAHPTQLSKIYQEVNKNLLQETGLGNPKLQ